MPRNFRTYLIMLKTTQPFFKKLLWIMTGFGKTCIVHTSDFAYLMIHKNHTEWYTDLKLSEIIKEE